jgi:hypothetical protein
VAFFENGSQLQLVLSVIVSSMAFALHVYSLPYVDRWLNVLQGTCLFMIWASLQAGMLMVTTQPNLSAGSALLTAISVANIVMLISPALLIVLAVLQIIPASIRARAAALFGVSDESTENSGEDPGSGIAGQKSHGELCDVTTPSDHAETASYRQRHPDDSCSTVQLEMVDMAGGVAAVASQLQPTSLVHGLPYVRSSSINPLFTTTSLTNHDASAVLPAPWSDALTALWAPESVLEDAHPISVSTVRELVTALPSPKAAATVLRFMERQHVVSVQQAAQLAQQEVHLQQQAQRLAEQDRRIQQLMDQIDG